MGQRIICLLDATSTQGPQPCSQELVLWVKKESSLQKKARGFFSAGNLKVERSRQDTGGDKQVIQEVSHFPTCPHAYFNRTHHPDSLYFPA
jgi:hypothetical protein